MQSVEIEDFSFGVFYNKAKLIRKFGYYIIVTKEARIGNINQLVLRNKKTIIYKGNDRYRNVKILKTFFQNIKKGERYRADKMGEKADPWPTPMFTSKVREEKLFHR